MQSAGEDNSDYCGQSAHPFLFVKSDAKTHADEDRKRREMVEERNKLDSMIYSVEKMVSENKEKLSADVLGPLETALTDAKTKLDSQSPDELKSALAALTAASHKMAEVLYKHGTHTTEPIPGEPKPDDGSKVVEAEFEDN